MISVNITIQNYAEFEAKLRALGEDLNDFQSALTETGKDLVDYFSTVPFSFRGRNYNSPWPDVTASRLAYKVKHYPAHDHDTLIATGAMQKSFVYNASRNQLTVGNTATYFADHQLGTSRLPQRQMMAVNGTVKDMIVKDIERVIQDKINKVKA